MAAWPSGSCGSAGPQRTGQGNEAPGACRPLEEELPEELSWEVDLAQAFLTHLDKDQDQYSQNLRCTAPLFYGGNRGHG